MGEIIAFPSRLLRVSQMRIREDALGILLPKFLGILWECGAGDRLGDIDSSFAAKLEGEINLGAIEIDVARYCLHVYSPTARSKSDKVFSAHIADRCIADPAHFRYWRGRCCLLSWKRGEWEDQIAAHGAAPRTIAHVLTAGLKRPTGH